MFWKGLPWELASSLLSTGLKIWLLPPVEVSFLATLAICCLACVLKSPLEYCKLQLVAQTALSAVGSVGGSGLGAESLLGSTLLPLSLPAYGNSSTSLTGACSQCWQQFLQTLSAVPENFMRDIIFQGVYLSLFCYLVCWMSAEVVARRGMVLLLVALPVVALASLVSQPYDAASSSQQLSRPSKPLPARFRAIFLGAGSAASVFLGWPRCLYLCGRFMIMVLWTNALSAMLQQDTPYALLYQLP
jgi:hypothetical protein